MNVRGRARNHKGHKNEPSQILCEPQEHEGQKLWTKTNNLCYHIKIDILDYMKLSKLLSNIILIKFGSHN